VSHQNISVTPLPNGKCFAVVELCLAKQTEDMVEMDFQLNHQNGFLDHEYDVSAYPIGHTICHLFEFEDNCSVYISLTGYGRNVNDEFCGAWSTIRALPVEIISFTGHVDNNKPCLEWEVTQEVDISRYVIESSQDGSVFIPRHQVQTDNSDTDHKTYSQCLPDVIDDERLFRLAVHELSGSVSYTDVISLEKKTHQSQQISLYPIPSKDMIFVPQNSSGWTITNIHGQEMTMFSESKGVLNIQGLQPGWYFAQSTSGQIGKFLKK